MSETKITVQAPAKTNLWLRVLGQRSDGFHTIDTRMVNLSLTDRIDLTWGTRGGVNFTCSDESLPTGEDNLVLKAVRAMEAQTRKKFGIDIHLEKSIPAGAGLGGGSSDAAAVIKAINELGKFRLKPRKLTKIGASIGSDVPFFIYGQPCDVSGRGEIVSPIEQDKIPRLPIILLKPNFQISAAWAYQHLAESKKVELPPNIPQICPWGKMENDLEGPVFMKFPVLSLMKTWLLKQPEVHAALLSGSGSTVLGVLRNFDGGEPLAERARAYFGEETWTFSGYTV